MFQNLYGKKLGTQFYRRKRPLFFRKLCFEKIIDISKFCFHDCRKFYYTGTKCYFNGLMFI